MKNNLFDELSNQAESLLSEVQRIREYLHQNPELSFEEHNTMAFVCEKLKDWNIEFEAKVAGTGVVGFIRGKFSNQTPHIALRADLDALPIKEENNVPYKSKVEGVMHACGHDVHTANLLGVAKILKQNEDQLKHPVLLLFQPGEEKAPGGASLILKSGVLHKQPIKAIYGLHVFPELEAGKVGFRSGLYMASCDEVHVEVQGKGGHAAMPHQCTDPIQAGIQFIQQAQSELHRYCDPKIPMVLRFGHFEALGATNVIPDKAKIKGTFRTMNEEWREQALNKLQAIADSISSTTGARLNLTIVKGYPYLENNPDVTETLKQSAQEILGAENVIDLPIRLTAEDFSFYSQEFPACFFRMGVRNEEQGIVNGVHHPKFDIDPHGLIAGMQVMCLPAFLD